MRRIARGILGAAVSATMVFGATPAITAYAGTITVTANEEAETQEDYTAFKVFDAYKNAGEDGVTYKIKSTDEWFGVLFASDGTPVSGNRWFTLNAIPGESGNGFTTYQVIPTSEMTDANAKSCADWLYANRGSIAGTQLSIADNEVADGYYLVRSTLGSNLGLATTDIPMNIVEKNSYPSVDKHQSNSGTAGTYSDNDVSVQVNDTVYYDFVVYVPASANKDITITDTMSAGLTFDQTTGVEGKSGAGESGPFEGAVTEGTDYSVSNASANGFTLTVTPNDSTRGKHIRFTFQATVNEKAVAADSVKDNEATLSYSNYTQVDKVKYGTKATGAVKYDGDTATANADTNALVAKDASAGITYLAGAEFKLQVDAGNGFTDLPVVKEGGYYRPATAGETGVAIVSEASATAPIVIRGLDADKGYQLVETKAPDGYNLLTVPASLTLTDNDASSADGLVLADVADGFLKKVENRKGSLLPTTGGIGTIVLYAAGGACIIGAGAYLVTRMRSGRKQ